MYFFLALIILAVIAAAAWIFFVSPRQRILLLRRSVNTILFRVSLPRAEPPKEGVERAQAEKERIGLMEQLYALVHQMQPEGLARFFTGSPHLTFELALPAIGEEIAFFVAVPRRWAQQVEKAIHGLYEHAHVERIDDYNIFHPQGYAAGAVVRYVRDWALPFRTYQMLESDPLRSVTTALTKLAKEGEGAAIQILVRPASRRKQAHGRIIARQMQKSGHSFDLARREMSLLGLVFHVLRGTSPQKAARLRTEQMYPHTIVPGSGPFESSPASRPWTQELWHPVTPLIQEVVKALEGKSSKTFLEANVRLLASAPTKERAREILEYLAGAFTQYDAPHLNALKVRVLKSGSMRDLLFRFSFRIFDSGRRMIINTEEATSLFHFPNVALETPKVKFLKAKPAPPPANLPQEGIMLGKNIYRGEETMVRLAAEDRRRHLYVVGQTGTGKTTLLREMIRQDIEAGHGVGVIDPHGDLAEATLSLVPQSRAQDVVYFDPADMERPMGLNMLEWKTVEQKDFAVQEMIAIFMKLFPPEVIGPMFEHNMRNAMLTLMADPEDAGTIAEIPRIFTDDAFMHRYLPRVTDPMVRAFWEKEMAKTTEFHKSEMLGYLISKVGRFVENEMMRNIIGQQRSGFNLREIIDEGKIFIANLSKGRVGEVNAALLGLILVAKMQMAAMSRAEVSEEQRRDFYLYIDEFQNFTTSSVGTILSEARKYRLNLVIAHQFIAQLADEIREAVFGNVGSIISFRVGPKDAEFLEKQFTPVFQQSDLIHVDNFHAYIRLMVQGRVERPFNVAISPPTPGNAAMGGALRELSRLRFGKPKGLVEAEILERSRLASPVAAEQSFVPGERNR